MTPYLPESTQAIVDFLAEKGGISARLSDTNVCVVRYGGKELYFIGDITPGIPFIYGIFAAGDEYMTAIMKDGGIPYKEKASGKATYKVLITRNGYSSVLPAKPVHLSVLDLAQQVLNLFPGADYISFELVADAVTNVSFSLDPYISGMMHKGKQTKPAIEVIADLLVNKIAL